MPRPAATAARLLDARFMEPRHTTVIQTTGYYLDDSPSIAAELGHNETNLCAYISPKYPYLPDLECIVIVYYKCSTGSTTWQHK